MFSFGVKCLITNKIESEQNQKIQEFLLSKLENPDFYKYCFQSWRTIKNTLKKWNAFSQEEELGYLHDDRYVLPFISI